MISNFSPNANATVRGQLWKYCLFMTFTACAVAVSGFGQPFCEGTSETFGHEVVHEHSVKDYQNQKGVSFLFSLGRILVPWFLNSKTNSSFNGIIKIHKKIMLTKYSIALFLFTNNNDAVNKKDYLRPELL